MLLPNKPFSYQESIISKHPVILKKLSARPYGVQEPYVASKTEMSGISGYIEVLDCLYVLGIIEFDKEHGGLNMLYEIQRRAEYHIRR